MPAPRKYPQELRERAMRLAAEARTEDPGLSLHQAVSRIGQRTRDVVVDPSTTDDRLVGERVERHSPVRGGSVVLPYRGSEVVSGL